MSDNKVFINNLVNSLEEKPVLQHPAIRVLPYILIVTITALIASFAFGIRSDGLTKINESSFLLENIFAYVISISALISLSWLAIPDMRENKLPVIISSILFASFLLLMMFRFITEGSGDAGVSHIYACGVQGGIIALISSFFSVLLIRKGYTTQPLLSSLMASIAGSMLGWAALRFICPLDSIGHAYILHFLPFVIIGFVLAVFSRKIFKAK